MNLAQSIATDRANGLLQDHKFFKEFCEKKLPEAFATRAELSLSASFFKEAGTKNPWTIDACKKGLILLGFSAEIKCGHGRMDEPYILLRLPATRQEGVTQW